MASLPVHFHFAIILVLAACSGAYSAYPGDTTALLDELRIKKLSVCYAYGVDAVGNGQGKGAEAAKKIWRPCFTKNVKFVIDGTPSYGVDAFADFTQMVFTRANYTGTQHMIGSQSVTFTGKRKAKQTSYLIATHKNPDLTISFYNGFYTDEVVQKKGVWLIKTRTLTTLSFLKLTGTPVGI